MEYQRYYVWSPLLRIAHWILALSVTGLVITGFYIHAPWTNTMLEGANRFPMATMRDIHFQLGFYFTGALLIRIYLLFFGNQHERIWNFLPITLKKFLEIPWTLAYYLYLTDRHPEKLGHNCWAGIIFILVFWVSAGQILSGAYLLYPESAIWQAIGPPLLGAQQEARLIHYLSMWFFLVFSCVHLYMVVWNDLRTKEGLVSSMINGRKYFAKKKQCH